MRVAEAPIGRYERVPHGPAPYDFNVTPEQELVRLFGVKGRELYVLRKLTGGVTRDAPESRAPQ